MTSPVLVYWTQFAGRPARPDEVAILDPPRPSGAPPIYDPLPLTTAAVTRCISYFVDHALWADSLFSVQSPDQAVRAAWLLITKPELPLHHVPSPYIVANAFKCYLKEQYERLVSHDAAVSMVTPKRDSVRVDAASVEVSKLSPSHRHILASIVGGLNRFADSTVDNEATTKTLAKEFGQLLVARPNRPSNQADTVAVEAVTLLIEEYDSIFSSDDKSVPPPVAPIAPVPSVVLPPSMAQATLEQPCGSHSDVCVKLLLTEHDWTLITNGCERVSLESGEALLRRGEPNDKVFRIRKGELMVEKDGVPLVRLGPGDIVGEMSFTDRYLGSMTVIARVPTTLYSMSATHLKPLFHLDKGLKLRFWWTTATTIALRLRSHYALCGANASYGVLGTALTPRTKGPAVEPLTTGDEDVKYYSHEEAALREYTCRWISPIKRDGKLWVTQYHIAFHYKHIFHHKELIIALERIVKVGEPSAATVVLQVQEEDGDDVEEHELQMPSVESAHELVSALRVLVPAVKDREGRVEFNDVIHRAYCLYPWKAQQAGQLSFAKGDVITVWETLGETQNDAWGFGSLRGERGYFPRTYVEKLMDKTTKLLGMPKSNHWNDILALGVLQSFSAGDVIMAEGSAAHNRLCLIRSGVVEVTRKMSSGRMRSMGKMVEDQMFGEVSFLLGTEMGSATVTAVEATRVTMIPGGILLKWILDPANYKAAARLLRYVAYQLDEKVRYLNV